MSDKVEHVFEKLANPQNWEEGTPSYEETVPKSDFRRGGAILGGIGGMGAGFGYRIAKPAIGKTKTVAGVTFQDSPKFIKKFAPAAIGLTAGSLAGRYLISTDKQYEEGRKSYNDQLDKDPELRKTLRESYQKMKNKKQNNE